MIQAQDLSRRYGTFTAVEGVSFAVDEGEIVGILGPNGAGKTTTIRMMTGFLPPTRGKVIVDGHDLFSNPLPARRQIGYLPENVALYTEMRVEEYLAYRAELEGMRRDGAREAIGNAIERCLLTEVRRQIIGTLSKGYRQRVGLAAAILHRPRVLVLDEPTVGLDPKQIIAIRELIRELGRERTLLLSTHILPEVELLCHRVLIIDRGRLVDQGTPEALRERFRGDAVVRVTVKGAPEGAGEALARLPGAKAVRPFEGEPGRFAVESSADTDLREAVFGLAVAHGWVLLELAEKKASLEDVFVRLTTRDAARDSAHDADDAAPAAPPAEPAAASDEPAESAAEKTEEVPS